MTKSRKQKQKKQDFLKKKLKVGKTAPKASNITDTSFVARTISIRNQHLEHDNDLMKRLSLLKHHNATVRRETLQIYQKAIPRIINTRIMAPLLYHAIPLIVDQDKDVRDGLLLLIEEIGNIDPKILVLQCNVFILYFNMAMTHIVPRIQAASTRFLICLMKYCSDEIVRQAWLKLLGSVLSVLGWGTMGSNQSAGAVQRKKRDSKNTKVHLDALFQLIEKGCKDPHEIIDEDDANKKEDRTTNPHLIPDMPQPYGYLKLFTRQLKTADNSSSANGVSSQTSLANQDLDTRQHVFKTEYLDKIQKQLAQLIKEGGECGKSANSINKLLEELFAD
ncbi:hypothetical protein KAFR_0D04330 [Kazachstania africana CBS 2517]|uniref:Pre-rRNA-processing protein n=1 Tax=Kazachstania africana (strain ATCC 22294 / BCRC 22015 / CBS 2517 / CECT 1963 / NBRC 1671 / NRRL Y-8276) TaxID=1071382 RepID=H2AUN1_KAZAF|nr:hypothetical protein KAFR_0D04330 [Kazachstania africana CBS 2517]CCF58081.1 hypothetical protein KAFR_0D04330 [Kazachstania africana CBS 2517]